MVYPNYLEHHGVLGMRWGVRHDYQPIGHRGSGSNRSSGGSRGGSSKSKKKADRDFFEGKGTAVLELFWSYPSSRIFLEWKREHPNEVLTTSIAEELIESSGAEELRPFLSVNLIADIDEWKRKRTPISLLKRIFKR